MRRHVDDGIAFSLRLVALRLELPQLRGATEHGFGERFTNW
jgi:hypothetical protein